MISFNLIYARHGSNNILSVNQTQKARLEKTTKTIVNAWIILLLGKKKKQKHNYIRICVGVGTHFAVYQTSPISVLDVTISCVAI